MQRRLVVVEPLSLFNPAGLARAAFAALWLSLCLVVGDSVAAGGNLLVEDVQMPPGYVARIDLNNPEEVAKVLRRAEDYYIENDFIEGAPPIVFVLHGPEVQIFNRQNYSKHKDIVDLAARLSAFEVVDVRVCQAQMRRLGEKEEFLFPFVGTVPFGPREVDRLLNEEDFVYF